ncbi:MauE/DoxX family redox-associated membrane protein [Chitinophaga sp.]|uniref:MauE/DoxX family redox-associated membrane protein n=1 Tax=Chitinophaga sp. TaxID=1869181 RepID=UPI0031D54D1A
MKKYFLAELASFAYILLFSYAAATKLFEIDKFEAQLILQPFSDSLVPFLMWAIPISMVLTVIVLLLPRYRTTGLKLATGLMLVFTGYTSLAKFGYFKDPPCTCAGIIPRFTWGQHLCFNLAFLGLGALALLIQANRKNLKFD